jgi:hypothetical protein
MRILINSNYNFYEKSLAILLPSIPDRNHDFEVVIGGSPWEYKKEVKNGINYHFVNYDNIDLTSFIFVSENPEIIQNKNFFLYIHDTTKMGPKFFDNLLININFNAKQYKTKEDFITKTKNIKLTCEGFSMNMGLYRTDYFKDNVVKALLGSIKNTDISDEGKMSSKVYGLKNEDIFLKDSNLSLTRKGRLSRLVESPYGTNVKRIEEYFPDLDFYKYKSNFDLSNNKTEIKL